MENGSVRNGGRSQEKKNVFAGGRTRNHGKHAEKENWKVVTAGIVGLELAQSEKGAGGHSSFD